MKRLLFSGIVQKGARRGTALGFPTANISFDGNESGIYAAKVLLNGQEYHAAVYADQKRKVLEAHLGKYSGGDLYGREIEIELLKKIREDKKFEDKEALRTAIAADVQTIRSYFLSLK